MAKFSRASTAYADDGSVVAANTPRMSSKGLLIEQEFNNLAPNGNLENGLDNNWYCNQTCTLALNNGVLVSTATGTDYITQVMITNIALPQNSTHSIYISCLVKNDSAASKNILRLFSKFHSTNYADTVGYKNYPAANTEYLLSGIIAGSGTNTDTTYDVSIQTVYANATTATGHITTYKKFIAIDLTAMFGAGNEPTAAVCDLLFNKPIYGDKKSDTLTIPGTAINAEQGTIEFDCIMEQPSSIEPSGVHWGLFSGVGALFSVYQPNGSKNTLRFSRGTWSGSTSTIVYWSVGDKLHIRARWNGTNIYLDATNKTTNVSVSSTNNSSVSTTITNLNFSNAGGVAQPINAYYSNLRISNVCRPDTDTTPAVDSHTTYYMPLTDNLGAQGQGVSVSSGNGATKQSRSGAGYRSMTAKAAVKSYILRTAKFYPLINTGITGAVNLSRTGSGYRTTAIQSVADVKLIEPGIEISTAVIERKGVTSVIERLSRTEVIGVPYIGDTVTLKAEFYTKGGVLADPVNISLKFFDSLKNQIGTTITIGSQHRISAGVYEYDYTVPSGYRNIFYEFAATQESTPQLIPGRIACKQRVDVGNWE